MAHPGRPRLLDPDLAAHVIAFVEAGLSLPAAASAAGVSERSLRRWRAEGQRQLAALSPEARIALAFGQSDPARDEIDWQESAAFLEAQYGERWSEVDSADRIPM